MTTTQTLSWKKRRRMASDGYYAESRCGRFRLYDSSVSGYSFSMRVDGRWQPERKEGKIVWHRTRKAAIAAAEKAAT